MVPLAFYGLLFIAIIVENKLWTDYFRFHDRRHHSDMHVGDLELELEWR